MGQKKKWMIRGGRRTCGRYMRERGKRKDRRTSRSGRIILQGTKYD